MKLEQHNLCDRCRERRDKFRAITGDMTLAEREAAIWLYFRGKRDCMCDQTWHVEGK